MNVAGAQFDRFFKQIVDGPHDGRTACEVAKAFDVIVAELRRRRIARFRILLLVQSPVEDHCEVFGSGDLDVDTGAKHDLRRALGGLVSRVRDSQHDQIAAGGLLDAAQYAVSMAYRIRFVMQMTAREAMHLAELRSQPQGHPTYRRVAQAIHRRIADVHPSIGAAFTFMSFDDVDLERLEAERRTDRKREATERG